MPNDTAENFRTWILAQSSIAAIVGDRVHQSHPPQQADGESTDDVLPWIWYRRSARDTLDVLDPAGEAAASETFDVECIALDLPTSQRLANMLFALNASKGEFGDQSVAGIFVDEQHDDYVNVNQMSDAGDEVSALSIQVFL